MPKKVKCDWAEEADAVLLEWEKIPSLPENQERNHLNYARVCAVLAIVDELKKINEALVSIVDHDRGVLRVITF